MINLIQKHLDAIVALCRKYDVAMLDVFGSALRSDFDEKSSDLDFVVQFNDFTIQNAFDKYFGLKIDLEAISTARSIWSLIERSRIRSLSRWSIKLV